MKILPFGDRALLINWPQRIDPEINAEVHAWQRAIDRAQIKGVAYSIPAFCSLTLVFNPLEVSFATLKAELESLKVNTDGPPKSGRTFDIPVAYNGADLSAVARHTGLSTSEIIKQHSNRAYQVYMIGFLPGFPYLGPVPEPLHCPRKTTPRRSVPAGAIGLAGAQTGIYPFEAPGGWQIIGQTPTPVFHPKAEAPFLLRAGDTVIFTPL
ncbi:MAG: 5-oxoprolinase subunit PxpB [Phaeodactylibacter sp.]|uniref:5-oxoprolinase subunit PxpB n=1 Tax=Phaeodactylibacter sp. TaxID=1940289 RepID=UPI0032ECC499